MSLIKRAKLGHVGFCGGLEFVIGDSHKVLPAFLGAHPDRYFDLMTVEGDHREAGHRVGVANRHA
jgi:hypothetical protein